MYNDGLTRAGVIHEADIYEKVKKKKKALRPFLKDQSKRYKGISKKLAAERAKEQRALSSKFKSEKALENINKYKQELETVRRLQTEEGREEYEAKVYKEVQEQLAEIRAKAKAKLDDIEDKIARGQIPPENARLAVDKVYNKYQPLIDIRQFREDNLDAEIKQNIELLKYDISQNYPKLIASLPLTEFSREKLVTTLETKGPEVALVEAENLLTKQQPEDRNLDELAAIAQLRSGVKVPNVSSLKQSIKFSIDRYGQEGFENIVNDLKKDYRRDVNNPKAKKKILGEEDRRELEKQLARHVDREEYVAKARPARKKRQKKKEKVKGEDV